MNEELKKKLEENGVDLVNTIRRFMGREDLYLKFLHRLWSDPNYNNLMQHLDEQNFEEAFKDAHTLKGVSANLGLDSVCQPVSEIVELLRGKEKEEIDIAKVEEKRKQLETEYAKIIQIINEYS